MLDNETLIFELTEKLEKLEDEYLLIDHKIEMAKAEFKELNKEYSPIWMAKTEYAAKCRKKDAARIQRQISELKKESRQLQEKDKKTVFIENLKTLLLKKYSHDSINSIYKEAGKMSEVGHE